MMLKAKADSLAPPKVLRAKIYGKFGLTLFRLAASPVANRWRIILSPP